MRLTVGAILYIVAIVVFIALAIGVKVSNVDLLPIGLAAVAAGLLLDWRAPLARSRRRSLRWVARHARA